MRWTVLSYLALAALAALSHIPALAHASPVVAAMNHSETFVRSEGAQEVARLPC